MHECLDNYFKEDLEAFKHRMENGTFTPHQKEMAQLWLTKLENSHDCDDERLIRNEIMAYFVQCTSTGTFEADPFTIIGPTDEPLYSQRYLLVA